MGFYENRILPHILNFAMDTADVREERSRCLKDIRGVVLEIGFGAGHNLPYYPRGVTKVVGIDPSGKSAQLGRKRIAAAPFPVETIGLSAEKIPLGDASFETIVSTFTLCSIRDVVRALREVRRVLAPAGQFYFVEHGLAEDPRVVRWQNRLNGIEQRVFGGCNLNRPISTLIEQAGFTIEQLDHGYLKGAPKFAGYLYRGVARRNDAALV